MPLTARLLLATTLAGFGWMAAAPEPAHAQFICVGNADGDIVPTNTTADGNGATVGGSSVVYGTMADATGLDSNNTAVGNSADASDRAAANTAVGNSANASGRNAANTATGAGANASGFSSGPQMETANLATGRGADASGGNLSGNSANIAIGDSPNATGDKSRNIAIGEGANASGDSGRNIALGDNAQATGGVNIAIGRDASTSGGARNVAIGDAAKADGFSSVAVGLQANANGTSGSNVAIGDAANASGAGTRNTAVGKRANATGANASAFGTSASATHANSAAFGQGATTSRDDQQVFGTSTNTYTMEGVTSAASATAQGSPTRLMTSNESGDLAAQTFEDLGIVTAPDLAELEDKTTANMMAIQSNSAAIQKNTKRTEENSEGVAMAMALENPDLTNHERFGVMVNWGTFEDQNAFGFSAMGVVHEGGGTRFAVAGGVGFGAEQDTVGGRAGARFTW